jgi:class 3 adenylate cyclase
VTFTEHFYDLDIRNVLPTIRVPALVLAREWKDPDEDAHIASLIPGATLIRFPGEGRQAWIGDRGEIVDAIHDFAGVERARTETHRVLATVLFTDIVASTEKAAELGDRKWSELAHRHHGAVRGLLGRYRGTEIDTAGDGFVATFDGPARAVRCAQAAVEAAKPLGIEIRAGVHTGEIELDGGDIRGIAVHIGARVGALAGPSEVLVSSTVKDLVAGSGLSFADAGEHELKGVPDRWRLYRVVSESFSDAPALPERPDKSEIMRR